MSASIGIFVFPGVEELDFVGPWEVLKAWERTESASADAGAGAGPSVFTLAVEAGPLQCAKGLTVTPDHTWASAPPIDVLVYPGGFGTRAHLGNDDVRNWVRGLAASGALLTSVCTGSLVFADAGLLDGRPATTHWGSLDYLARLGTGIEVRADDRFVDDGNIITSAGVSAGIDMALHLVRRLGSEERARQVKRYIQYDPQPPV